jgi:hypothetical protein
MTNNRFDQPISSKHNAQSQQIHQALIGKIIKVLRSATAPIDSKTIAERAGLSIQRIGGPINELIEKKIVIATPNPLKTRKPSKLYAINPLEPSTSGGATSPTDCR